MSRLPLSAALMTIAVLACAPGAAAKEITAMKICGADRCAHVKRSTAQRLHDTGGLGGAAHERGRGPRPLLPGDRNDRRRHRPRRGPLRAGLCPAPPGRAPAGRLPAGRVDAALGRGREDSSTGSPGTSSRYPAKHLRAEPPPARPLPPRVWKPWQEADAEGRRGVCRRSSPACPRCWSSGSGSGCCCSDGAAGGRRARAPSTRRHRRRAGSRHGRGRHAPRRWPPRSRGRARPRRPFAPRPRA